MVHELEANDTNLSVSSVKISSFTPLAPPVASCPVSLRPKRQAIPIFETPQKIAFDIFECLLYIPHSQSCENISSLGNFSHPTPLTTSADKSTRRAYLQQRLAGPFTIPNDIQDGLQRAVASLKTSPSESLIFEAEFTVALRSNSKTVQISKHLINSQYYAQPWERIFSRSDSLQKSREVVLWRPKKGDSEVLEFPFSDLQNDLITIELLEKFTRLPVAILQYNIQEWISKSQGRPVEFPFFQTPLGIVKCLMAIRTDLSPELLTQIQENAEEEQLLSSSFHNSLIHHTLFPNHHHGDHTSSTDVESEALQNNNSARPHTDQTSSTRSSSFSQKNDSVECIQQKDPDEENSANNKNSIQSSWDDARLEGEPSVQTEIENFDDYIQSHPQDLVDAFELLKTRAQTQFALPHLGEILSHSAAATAPQLNTDVQISEFESLPELNSSHQEARRGPEDQAFEILPPSGEPEDTLSPEDFSFSQFEQTEDQKPHAWHSEIEKTDGPLYPPLSPLQAESTSKSSSRMAKALMSGKQCNEEYCAHEWRMEPFVVENMDQFDPTIAKSEVSQHLRFMWHYKAFMEHRVSHTFQEIAKDTVLLFVPGIYTGRMPGHKGAQERIHQKLQGLRNLGLACEVIEVINDGEVLLNSTIIATHVQTIPYKHQKQKVILVGHSKGAVDIGVALTLHPEIRAQVRCFISMQSPFYGSRLANDVVNNSVSARLISTVLANVMGLDPHPLKEMSTTFRREFLKSYPFPEGAVPVLSYVSSAQGIEDYFINMCYKYTKRVHGIENDGLVCMTDAIVPGSQILAMTGIGHNGQTVASKFSDPNARLFAIVATALDVANSSVPSFSPARSELQSSLVPSLHSHLHPSIREHCGLNLNSPESHTRFGEQVHQSLQSLTSEAQFHLRHSHQTSVGEFIDLTDSFAKEQSPSPSQRIQFPNLHSIRESLLNHSTNNKNEIQYHNNQIKNQQINQINNNQNNDQKINNNHQIKNQQINNIQINNQIKNQQINNQINNQIKNQQINQINNNQNTDQEINNNDQNEEDITHSLFQQLITRSNSCQIKDLYQKLQANQPQPPRSGERPPMRTYEDFITPVVNAQKVNVLDILKHLEPPHND